LASKIDDVSFLNLREKERTMPDIFIEKQNEKNWHAIRNSATVATGTTQNECGCKAKKLYPDDPLLAERVENAKRGNPDHWRRLYPTC
jgi:hypothetical protein